MLLKCGVGEDSWESLGLQGDPTCKSYRKSVLNIYWKDWCWSWNSNTLATWWEEPTHWKRPWCWERLKEARKGDDRGWAGWMASLTGWTWVWVGSGSWWWTGKPGMLTSVGSQRVGHDSATELTHKTVNCRPKYPDINCSKCPDNLSSSPFEFEYLRTTWKSIFYFWEVNDICLCIFFIVQPWSAVDPDDKESACNTGDLGSIPGWGRSPGEENGYPRQYSCLETPTDRGAWRATVRGSQRVGHYWASNTLELKTAPSWELENLLLLSSKSCVISRQTIESLWPSFPPL